MAISGSPTASRCCSLRSRMASSESRCSCAVDARRVGEVQDRIAAVAEQDALVDAGQEAAAPVGRRRRWCPWCRWRRRRTPAGRCSRCPGRRSSRRRGSAGRTASAGVHQDLRRGVIERIAVHRLDDGDVVGHVGEVRQQLGQFRAALAVPGELELRAEQLGVGVDERGAIALEQIGRRQLAVPFGQFRLVVEQFQVARPAGHEQVDHALGLGGEVRQLGRQRVAGAAAARGATSLPSSSPSAIAPRPTPHCLKNQRRVTSLRYSLAMSVGSWHCRSIASSRSSRPCLRLACEHMSERPDAVDIVLARVRNAVRETNHLIPS